MAHRHLVEHFSEPVRGTLPGPSVALVRLSNESVSMAWTGLDHVGRYAVRSAAVGLSGLYHSTTLSDPGTDSVLAALAPGPRSERLSGIS